MVVPTSRSPFKILIGNLDGESKRLPEDPLRSHNRTSLQIEVHEEDCLTMNDLDLTLEFLSREIVVGSQAIRG